MANPTEGFSRTQAIRRMLLPVLLTVVLFLLAMFFVILPAVEQALYEQKRDGIRSLAQCARSIAASYHQKVESGDLTLEQAQQKAAARIQTMRYGPEGRDYFWINNTEPRIIMHPYMEEIVGQDVRDLTDFSAERKPIFDMFRRKAQSESGGGFVEYTWQYYGHEGQTGRKISYVTAFEEWGWVIGTGVYIDDVEAQIGGIMRRMGLTAAAIVFIMSALLLLVVGQGMRIIGLHARAREKLQTAEHEHRELLETLNLGVYRSYVREGGRFLQVNDAMVEMLGYANRRELMECRIRDLWMNPPERSEFIARLEQEGRLKDVELELKRQDGTPVWVACSAIARRDAEGNFEEMDGIVEDITERRLRQQELHQYRQNLEELVAERTDELERAQQELVRAEQMALLGRLTGSISHEMRNPLGVIRSSVYYVGEKLGEDPAEEIRRALSRIERSVGRCDHIVAQLLEYAGANSTVRVPVMLDSWMESILDEYRFPAELQDAELVQDLRSGVTVEMDAQRMARAMEALLDNCRDAFLGDGVVDDLEMGQRAPRVTIRTCREDGFVRVTVEDNGPGLPVDVRVHTFEPLFSTKAFGVGLGLSICCQVVDHHGGEVRLDSEAGQGTRVTLRLPLAQEE